MVDRSGGWFHRHVTQATLDVAVAGMLVCAVTLTAIYPLLEHEFRYTAAASLSWVCFGVASLGLAVHRPRARGWYWGAASLGAGAASDSWLVLIGRPGDYSYPPVWLGYLICYGCGIWALITHMRRWVPMRRLHILLNSLITTVGALSIIASLAYVVLRQDGISDPARLNVFVSIALDAILLGLVARMWFSQEIKRSAVKLLTLTPASLVVFDVGRLLGYHPAYRPDVRWEEGWQFALVFTAWAITRPSSATARTVELGDSEVMGQGQAMVLTASIASPAAVVLLLGLMGQPVSWVLTGASQLILAGLAGARVSLLVTTVRSRTAQIELLARSDPLTGVANRRRWDSALEEIFLRIQQDPELGPRTWIAMLDLDHFKRYNDTFGHLAGDQVLRAATAAWCERLDGVAAEVALLARYGGEEFGVLLVLAPPSHPGTALEAAESVRAATPLGLTASMGLARWEPTDTPDALLGRADAALYRAKSTGRDRLELAGHATAPVSPTSATTGPDLAAG